MKKTKFHCSSEAQKRAIRKYYAQKNAVGNYRDNFPKKFPFWARLKISKDRTTLVIDEEKSLNKKTNKEEDMFVHREATSKYKKDRLKIDPNPDSSKNTPMYLKRPTKLPIILFKPHNKKMSIPDNLVEQYSKNNK